MYQLAIPVTEWGAPGAFTRRWYYQLVFPDDFPDGPSNPTNVALVPDRHQSKSQMEVIVAKPHDMANPERSLRSNGDLRKTEGFDAQDVVGRGRKGP